MSTRCPAWGKLESYQFDFKSLATCPKEPRIWTNKNADYVKFWWDLQSSSLPKHKPPEVVLAKAMPKLHFFQIALRRSQKSPKMVHWGDDRHSSSIGHGCRRKAVDSFGTFSVILRAMQCAFLKQWKTMQNPPRQRGWKSVLLFCCPMPVTACALLRKRGMKSNLTNTR